VCLCVEVSRLFDLCMLSGRKRKCLVDLDILFDYKLNAKKLSIKGVVNDNKLGFVDEVGKKDWSQRLFLKEDNNKIEMSKQESNMEIMKSSNELMQQRNTDTIVAENKSIDVNYKLNQKTALSKKAVACDRVNYKMEIRDN
jgi:hypothetical protein